MMKYKLLILLPALLFAFSGIHAQISLPQASPPGSVTSVIGLTEVKISYFRPKMRERKIFGEGSDYLVPFGELWRTGANSGTIVSFEDKVTIQGKSIEGGQYLLFTVPGANQWEVILYSDISLGGNTAGYDSEKEIARFSVTPEKIGQTVTTLTFNVSDIAADNTSASIQLTWENTSVKLPFEVDFDSKVMAAIESSLTVNPSTYLAAASYYFQTDRDIDQALKWMDMYLNANEQNSQQFWNLYLKARMLKKKGDIKAARKVSERSLELAKAAENDFGYIKLNTDFLNDL